MSRKEPTGSSEESLIRQRLQKLEKLKGQGVNPFPAGPHITHTLGEVLAAFGSLKPEDIPDPAQGPRVETAGRLMSRRDMGKASFGHLRSGLSNLQIYLKSDVLGPEAYGTFLDLIDLGDILGVAGRIFRTKTGELTLRVETLRVLSKSLRPWPEKWHGLSDVEIRSRQRELDLATNDDSQRRFRTRSLVVSALREALIQRGFLEVETPLMQTVAGGALARPFITHHEALDVDLYLRIAPELYLKRLLVGGLEKVFEIGRSFRNEGVDTRHNPEFTLLEAYQAYTDYEGIARLTEELIREAAKALGLEEVAYKKKAARLGQPFVRARLPDLFAEHARIDLVDVCRNHTPWHEAAAKAGVAVEKNTPERKCFDRIFDERILPHLTDATFVMDYPRAFSPLAKAHRSRPELSERFELFIAGEEVANAYSEQNDPQDQRARLDEQARVRRSGDEEAMVPDEEFLLALEHGMPPAGGLGIGVDRLSMIFTGTDSIREVILFPLLKPR